MNKPNKKEKQYLTKTQEATLAHKHEIWNPELNSRKKKGKKST